ncbi:MAG: PIN domain-containing protein [Pseudomonadota bacterium]
MSTFQFVDTNVLVYVFDSSEPLKQNIASNLLRTEGASGKLILSTQVLQEFFVTVTRKLAKPLDTETAYRALEQFAEYPLISPDKQMVLSAARRHLGDMVSFGDALSVEAALTAGCSELLSEDLQHERQFDDLVVINPFISASKSIHEP